MAKSFDLATSPSHLLRRANQFANDLYTDEDDADGLTQRQLAVLHAIDQNDTMSQTELVRATGIDRSTLADMIVRMQKRELIARKRTEKDQRANAVRITSIGKRALRAALPVMQRVESALLEALPARSRADFLRCLTSLAQTHSDKLADDETNGKTKKRSKR